MGKTPIPLFSERLAIFKEYWSKFIAVLDKHDKESVAEKVERFHRELDELYDIHYRTMEQVYEEAHHTIRLERNKHELELKEKDRIVEVLSKKLITQTEISTIDPLTQLTTREAFLKNLAHLLGSQNLQPNTKAIGLLFMDVNDFKEINDGLGHTVGNIALAYVGHIIGHELRVSQERDTDHFQRITHRKSFAEKLKLAAGRYGGDEFVITVELTSPEGLGAVGTRIKMEIDSATNQKRYGDKHGLKLKKPLSVAVGGVSYVLCPYESTRSRREIADQMTTISDLEMYKSKEDGRVHFKVIKSKGDELVTVGEHAV